jgi:hypothetical protein
MEVRGKLEVNLMTVYYIRQQHLLTTHTLVIFFDVTDGASLVVPRYTLTPTLPVPLSAPAY